MAAAGKSEHARHSRHFASSQRVSISSAVMKTNSGRGVDLSKLRRATVFRRQRFVFFATSVAGGCGPSPKNAVTQFFAIADPAAKAISYVSDSGHCKLNFRASVVARCRCHLAARSTTGLISRHHARACLNLDAASAWPSDVIFAMASSLSKAMSTAAVTRSDRRRDSTMSIATANAAQKNSAADGFGNCSSDPSSMGDPLTFASIGTQADGVGAYAGADVRSLDVILAPLRPVFPRRTALCRSSHPAVSRNRAQNIRRTVVARRERIAA